MLINFFQKERLHLIHEWTKCQKYIPNFRIFLLPFCPFRMAKRQDEGKEVEEER
jgi:hypothetical protein